MVKDVSFSTRKALPKAAAGFLPIFTKQLVLDPDVICLEIDDLWKEGRKEWKGGKKEGRAANGWINE